MLVSIKFKLQYHSTGEAADGVDEAPVPGAAKETTGAQGQTQEAPTQGPV